LRRVCGASVDPREGVFYSGAKAAPAAGGTTPYVLAQPTANTYSTSVRVQKSRGPVAALLLGGAFLTVVVAGGVALVMKQRAEVGTKEATPSASLPKTEVAG